MNILSFVLWTIVSVLAFVFAALALPKNKQRVVIVTTKQNSMSIDALKSFQKNLRDAQPNVKFVFARVSHVVYLPCEPFIQSLK